MRTPHYLGTVTRLDDGRVLAAGGSDGASDLSSAELYNPATNSWAGAASMATARAQGSATLLGNGKVLVAGGRNASFVSAAELYDPSTNAWSSAGSMATPRLGQTATVLGGGTVLIAGGYSGSSDLSSAERYDPVTNGWSPAGDMTAQRAFACAAALESGRVLVVGGRGGSSGLATADLYDPVPVVPAVTGAAPAAAPVGKVVTIDGSDLSGAIAVWFGGAPATLSGVSDTHLTAKVPNGATTGPVVVLTPAALVWSPTDFKVKPKLKTFSPTSGGPGTVVTITGTAFTGATKVQFNAKSATFTVNSYTKITATVPAGATSGRITIVTPGGKGKSKTDFTVT
jgi:hypothetical protein